METWSVHHLRNLAVKELDAKSAADLVLYAQTLRSNELPVIFTLNHLAKIVGVEYSFLRKTVERKREASNYRIFAIRKRSGGFRYIHALNNQIQATQQFLNSELLQKLPTHRNSYAFHARGGIRNCAAAHCGARWIFQFDLDNFFYRINETKVYSLFCSMGYRPLLAMELARICTTTLLPTSLRHFLLDATSTEDHYKFYSGANVKMGILPQGAPSSPMISNLVASELDERLATFAIQNGFAVTRYADDITLSVGGNFPAHLSIAKIQRSIVHIIRHCGFKENAKKTRVAGPGSKKIVLGLLVDGDLPRISKETYRRIDRHLYASLKYGLAEVAKHEKFDSTIGFYHHLRGLVCFVNDVDAVRGEQFKMQFAQIPDPWRQRSMP